MSKIPFSNMERSNLVGNIPLVSKREPVAPRLRISEAEIFVEPAVCPKPVKVDAMIPQAVKKERRPKRHGRKKS